MTVRFASPEDALRIATIHVEAWRVAYRGIVPDEFLDALSLEQRHAAWRDILTKGESQTWVAEDEDAALGWVSAGSSRDPDASESAGEIWALYVDPRHWNKNVGRTLCTAAAEELRAQGFTEVTLWVLKDNARALRFYLSNGFIHDDGSDRFMERGGKALSEIRMKKRLV